MLLPTKPLVFLASTAAKAWEPLSVAVASSTASTAGTGTPYLFPTALIVCHVELELRTRPQSGLLLYCYSNVRASLWTGVRGRQARRTAAHALP